MIRYALTCSQGHGFDSWFKSGDAFDKVQKAGMIACHECGDTEIRKSVMAPRIAKSGEVAVPKPLSAPENPQEKALSELRAKIEANSEDVGKNFATEARKIHDGDAPERSIIGEARFDEAKSLIEDGIPVAPLPFIPQRKTN